MLSRGVGVVLFVLVTSVKKWYTDFRIRRYVSQIGQQYAGHARVFVFVVLLSMRNGFCMAGSCALWVNHPKDVLGVLEWFICYRC